MKDDSFIFLFIIGLVLGLFTSMIVILNFRMIKNNAENDGKYNMSWHEPRVRDDSVTAKMGTKNMLSRHEQISCECEQLVKTETEVR